MRKILHNNEIICIVANLEDAKEGLDFLMKIMILYKLELGITKKDKFYPCTTTMNLKDRL